jgi:hypothetical protein
LNESRSKRINPASKAALTLSSDTCAAALINQPKNRTVKRRINQNLD